MNRNQLEWWQVFEACRAAGFECERITPAISGTPDGEPWHIIDFNAFGAAPTDFEDGEFEMNTEQNRMLENIYAAIFNGCRSMDDGGKIIAESLATIAANVAPIQRVVNGKVVAMSILRRSPTPRRACSNFWGDRSRTSTPMTPRRSPRRSRHCSPPTSTSCRMPTSAVSQMQRLTSGRGAGSDAGADEKESPLIRHRSRCRMRPSHGHPWCWSVARDTQKGPESAR